MPLKPSRAALLLDRGSAWVALHRLLAELSVCYVVRIQNGIWGQHRSDMGCLRGFSVAKWLQL